MAVPTLKFQIALASNPGDATFDWTTITGTRSIAYSRGQPNEFGRMETGASTIVIGDPESLLDPNNEDSTYYPNVRKMRPIRAVLTLAGTDYPLFQHFIERLPRTRAEARAWTERTITGTDAFAWFALAGLKGQSYSSEASGTRWGNVLDDIGWPTGRRDIDTGSSTLDAATFADNASDKALDHLLAVVESENGFGFMDAAGDARFIARHSLITSFTTVEATFADGKAFASGSYPDALVYQELEPEETEVVNDYSGKRTADDATAVAVSDATSIADYGPRSTELTFLVSTDTEVESALEWKLGQTKDPHDRIDAITVRPGRDSTAWTTVLGLEVGDRVTVVEQPAGFDSAVENDYLILHIAATLPAALEEASFTFQLMPATAFADGLVLDDAVAGKLDTGKLAY